MKQNVLQQVQDTPSTSPRGPAHAAFLHLEVPAHYSQKVRTCLDVTFGQQWIGHGGPVR